MTSADTYLLDTSFLIARRNLKDENHAQAVACFEELQQSSPRLKLVLTDYIFDEFAALLVVRLNKARAVEICRAVHNDPIIRLFPSIESCSTRLGSFFKKHSTRSEASPTALRLSRCNISASNAVSRLTIISSNPASPFFRDKTISFHSFPPTSCFTGALKLFSTSLCTSSQSFFASAIMLPNRAFISAMKAASCVLGRLMRTL